MKIQKLFAIVMASLLVVSMKAMELDFVPVVIAEAAKEAAPVVAPVVAKATLSTKFFGGLQAGFNAGKSFVVALPSKTVAFGKGCYAYGKVGAAKGLALAKLYPKTAIVLGTLAGAAALYGAYKWYTAEPNADLSQLVMNPVVNKPLNAREQQCFFASNTYFFSPKCKAPVNLAVRPTGKNHPCRQEIVVTKDNEYVGGRLVAMEQGVVLCCDGCADRLETQHTLPTYKSQEAAQKALEAAQKASNPAAALAPILR